MSSPHFQYEPGAKCVYYTVGKSDVFDVDDARRLSKLARSGEWEGRQVERAEVRFEDDKHARSHADALGFLDIATVVKGKVISGAPIRVRKDFGL